MIEEMRRHQQLPTGAARRPMTGRRRTGAALLTAVLMVAAACGNGTNDTSSAGGDTGGDTGGDRGGDKAPSSLTVAITFDVEGEETLKGSVTEPSAPTVDGKNPQTCAEYANGSQNSNGKRYFVLPLQLGGQLNGKLVGLQVRVKEYTGPGLYTEEKLTSEGVAFGVRVGNRPYVKQGDGSGSVVTTNADGSGNFYFERLSYSTGADTSPGISGMIEWTCKNT